MTTFDPDRSEIKFDSMIIFMTHSAVSYQKRIIRLKSKIWPQKTPFDPEVLRPSI